MCWPFLTDRTSCLTWLDSTCGPGSVSRLFLGGQRSPFSFRAIPTTPASSRVRDSSFITVVSERGLVLIKDRSRTTCEDCRYYFLCRGGAERHLSHPPPNWVWLGHLVPLLQCQRQRADLSVPTGVWHQWLWHRYLSVGPVLEQQSAYVH